MYVNVVAALMFIVFQIVNIHINGNFTKWFQTVMSFKMYEKHFMLFDKNIGILTDRGRVIGIALGAVYCVVVLLKVTYC